MKDIKAKNEDKESKKKLQLAVKDQKAKKRQAKVDRNAKKDPNKPKRAPTAFFIFLEEFRETFKKENPNVKGVTAVGKACGDKWKEMSDQEKTPYMNKAAQRRAEYEKALASYNKKLSSGPSAAEDEADGSEEDDEEEEDDD